MARIIDEKQARQMMERWWAEVQFAKRERDQLGDILPQAGEGRRACRAFDDEMPLVAGVERSVRQVLAERHDVRVAVALRLDHDHKHREF